jgi:glycosyltransferase 2 family protein
VSIALERILDLVAVLLVLGAVLLAGGPLPLGLLRTGYVMAGAAALLLAALVIYVGWTEQCLRWTARLMRFLPHSWQDKVLAQLRAGAVGAVTLKRPAAWAPLLVSSIAQWALMCGCIAVSCFALGLQTPPPAYAAVLGLTIVGMSLPSGPGYVGSIQLAFSLALAPFGVPTADAIAASLFYHLLVCGSLTVAGVGSLYRLGGRWRSIARLQAS